MSVTNRVDDNSPTKTHFNICVFGQLKRPGTKQKGVQCGRSNAKSELWASWGSVSRNVAQQKLCGATTGGEDSQDIKLAVRAQSH